jgi:multisubunit Na+/H+ antiporter MnhE subunit
MILSLLIVALLTAVYALALASLAPLDLLTGALLGGGLLVASRAVTVPRGRLPVGTVLRRIGAFVPFTFAVVRDVVVSTWRVALIVLGVRPLRAPGIVKVPIGGRSPVGVAVSSLVETLSPGSVLIDIDWEDRIMYIHVIDASDPDKVRRQMQSFYDRYQRHVFP